MIILTSSNGSIKYTYRHENCHANQNCYTLLYPKWDNWAANSWKTQRSMVRQLLLQHRGDNNKQSQENSLVKHSKNFWQSLQYFEVTVVHASCNLLLARGHLCIHTHVRYWNGLAFCFQKIKRFYSPLHCEKRVLVFRQGFHSFLEEAEGGKNKKLMTPEEGATSPLQIKPKIRCWQNNITTRSIQ